MRGYVIGLFLASLCGCVSDGPGKPQGEEGGPCFGNFTCNAGLVCDKGPNICRKSDASIDDSGTTEAGTDAGADAGADAGGDAGPCTGATLAWYKGEDLTDSIGSNPLVALGAGLLTGPGQVDKALDFGPANSARWYSTTTGLTGATQVSVAFWVQLQGTPVAAKSFITFLDQANTPVASVNVAAGQTQLVLAVQGGTATATVDTTLNHVVFVIQGSKVSSFVNGKQETNSNVTQFTGFPNNQVSVVLGAGSTAGAAHADDAKIDELSIHTKAFSLTDVQSIFAIEKNHVRACREP